MSNKVEIYFIRHTDPLIKEGVCYGHLDCAITNSYAKQFVNIRTYFKDKDINEIYSSPLQRCAILAKDLARLHHLPVIYKEELKEINFGDWEGLKWDDIPRAKIDEWNHNRLDFQFPNGETPRAFVQRVLRAYFELQTTKPLPQEKNRSILVITHAGVIRSILANILCLSFSDSLNLQVDKASISHCSFNRDVLEYSLLNIS